MKAIFRIEVLATLLFSLAVIHTFSVSFFSRLSMRGGIHSGFWYWLSEIEVTFGIWSLVLIIFLCLTEGLENTIQYINSQKFTEPMFVFAIMIIAASQPIFEFSKKLVHFIARFLPIKIDLAKFFIIMSLIPLSGSLITEPAAMTLAAFFLHNFYLDENKELNFKYLIVAVLFVNISIGGVLTSYAAPAVLMVADVFSWKTSFMISNFGWKAAVAVFLNAAILTFIFSFSLKKKSEFAIFKSSSKLKVDETDQDIPPFVIIFHLLFLAGVIMSSKYPPIFMGLLILFVGFTEAYKQYQTPLIIKESLMVAFFLAGLIVLGGMQKWWLQGFLEKLEPMFLFLGVTFLTSIIDNAALTYLGSLVDGTSLDWRYMLVAGSVTGGGLTIIANAPNPAGLSILKAHFPSKSISAFRLFICSLFPTLIAALMLLVPI